MIDADTKARKLIEKLREKGWTIAAVAREVGVSPNTAHRWRRGERHPENTHAVELVLQSLLEHPVPTRKYRRRRPTE